MKNNLFRLCVLVIAITFSSNHLFAFAKVATPDQTITYKKVGTRELIMNIYKPDTEKFKGIRPAILFFFGGGWTGGTVTQFEKQAKILAQEGFVAFAADYRVKNVDNTDPYPCVEDAKSAVRYLRNNFEKLGIDPNKIVVSGGSAGGHIAAATALLDGYNAPTDDLNTSPVPNALVLFNPVVDNGPAGYGYERIGDQYKNFSPLHNLKKGVPPTIMFLGDKDKHIPTITLQYYSEMSKRLGSRCDLYIYEGEQHGFFNSDKYIEETLSKTRTFLRELGFYE